MLSAASLRRQIESALEQRIPGALTPRPRTIRDVAPTGIPELDALLNGGFPIGAITELVGPQCSGRTTLALAFLAEQTAAGKAVAWIDVSDTLDPESAAAAGVDLSRQLWVRCGETAAANPTRQHETPPSHRGAPLLVEHSRVPAPAGSCGSTHPRGEVHGLSDAIGAFMQPDTFARAITPRAPDPKRPDTRKNRLAGTPGAPNRKLTGNAAFPHRAHDRDEQTPTDRLPPRREANLNQSPPKPKNVSDSHIARTAQTAGAWNDNRNNASGRAFKTAPQAIAAGLPHVSEMEARARGQGHGIERGPFDWKPSLTHLRTPHSTASPKKHANPNPSLAGDPPPRNKTSSPIWKALDHALRATDLLLAAGGFTTIVLDLGSIAPELSWRIPLATWFRFRSGAERARTVLLLLTQHPCARSSAELVLRLSPAEPHAATTILTGAGFQVAIDRQRFETNSPPPSQTTPIPEEHVNKLHLINTRKPPQRESGNRSTSWQRSTAWARGGQ